MSEEPRIPAYFSHSYRPADREVNLFFLEEMWKRGFTFTVDPKSSSLSTTHLEIMMRDNACFIGVVTRRDEERVYRSSPFAVYEFGLSLLEPKPRIMFLEHGVPAHHFLDEPRLYFFERERLGYFRFNETAIDQLREEAEAFVKGAPIRKSGLVGLALPRTGAYAEVRPRIVELLVDAGYAPVDVEPRLESYEAAAELDRLDFLVIDVIHEEVEPWLFPFSRGKATPSIKLVHHRPGLAEPPSLPSLASVRALSSSAGAGTVALWWQNPEELLAEFERRIERLHVPRRGFADLSDGQRYFRSLGRVQGPVFLSNAQGDNTLAREVERRLELYNIEHFHYIFRNSIQPGSPWKPRLLAKVRECRIFVPLISRNYWNSDWCRRELQVARELQQRGRMAILPYFLDGAKGDPIPEHGRWLGDDPLATQARIVVEDVDRELAMQTARLSRPRSGVTAAERAVTDCDFAFVATTKAQAESLIAMMEGPAPVIGTLHQPNRWGWTVGDLHLPGPRRYRMLVTQAIGAQSPVADAVRATADVFEPEQLILLADATSLDPALRPGSLLVPDRVYGFMLRGTPKGYVPRPDWDCPVPPSPWEVATVVAEGFEGGPLVCGEGGTDGAPPPGEATAVWPDALAINYSLIDSVAVLDDLHQRGRITGFAVLCSITDGAAAVSHDTLRDLLATWSRPPRGENV